MPLLFAVLALALAAAWPAKAQIPGLPNLVPGTQASEPAPAPDRRADIAALDRVLKLIDDETGRKAFAEELRQLRTTLSIQGPQRPATETEENDGLIGALAASAASVAADFPQAALGAPVSQKLAEAGQELDTRIASQFGGDETLAFLGWALPAACISVGTMFALFRSPWLTRRRRMRVRPTSRAHLLRTLLVKAFFGFLPPLAAIVLSLVLSAWFATSWLQTQLFIAMTSPVVAAVMARQIALHLLLALGMSRGWRLVGYAQRRLLPWIAAIAAVATIDGFMREFAVRVAIGRSTADLVALFFDILVAVLSLVFVMRQRLTVRSLLIKGRDRGGDGKASGILANVVALFADRWHLFAILFILANVVSRLLGIGGGNFFADATVAVLYILGGLVGLTLANTVFARAAEALTRRRASTRKAILRRYLDVLHLGVQVAMATIVTIACIDLWGFDVWGWLTTEDGSRVLRPALSLLVVPTAIWIVWITVDTVIEHALAPIDHRGRQRQQSARIKTLLPLLRNLVFVASSLVVVIAVLANLGVNVVPLLAGAGVIGLAFSFGSQQLVQDVITGFFILFEDTIAIGDSINTGDRSGVVEGLNIRTVKIRDGAGALHSVPFSQIKALRNDSRDFGIHQIALTLGYEADPDRALAIMAEVGGELRTDRKFAGLILAPIEIWGVDGFTPEGVVIKGAIRCMPLQQWPVGREFNRRMKQRLDAEGITLFTPWQKLHVEQIGPQATRPMARTGEVLAAT